MVVAEIPKKMTNVMFFSLKNIKFRYCHFQMETYTMINVYIFIFIYSPIKGPQGAYTKKKNNNNIMIITNNE